MSLAIIVAMAENGVIGSQGHLPWRLPADLQRFKRLTTGHALIMGRKTFESVGRPLPERRNIVMTRQADFRAPGVQVAHSLDEALAAAQGDPEPFVAGGGEIYQLALPRADRLYLTLVHTRARGDVCFPQTDFGEWHLVEETRHEAGKGRDCAFSFRTYRRASAS